MNDSDIRTLNLSWNGIIILYIQSFYLNKIGNECVIQIAYAIVNNTTLHILNLSWNQIINECVTQISSMLNVNSTLHTPHLSNNRIGYECSLHITSAPFI